MYVPKDLDNRWTDMVLLYSEASYRSWGGMYVCLSVYLSVPKDLANR